MTESNRIEYKRELTDSLEKEVVAFLNYHDGGIIYIGIDDDETVGGVAECDAVQLKIKDRLKNNIQPSCMGLFDVIHETRDSKDIIKIIIAGGLEKPYHLKKFGMSEKGCFMRVGSATEPMPARMIEELFARRTRNSITRIRSPRQDLTFEQLKIYYNEAGFELGKQFAANLELFTDRLELTSAGTVHSGKEQDDFFAGFSIPRNKTLMRVFKDLEIVEYLGSGMPRILKAYPREAYEFSSRFIRTTFPIDPASLELEKEVAAEEEKGGAMGGPIGGVIGGPIKLTSRQSEIVELIKSNTKITYRELSKNLDINDSAVDKHLNNLKEKGVLKRIGGTRGHWEIAGETVGETVGETTGGAMGGVIGGAIKLTSRQSEVVELIKANTKITYGELSKNLDISDSAVDKHIKKLKEKGVLKRIGGTRGHWEIIGEDAQ